jgi:hypothetical protein
MDATEAGGHATAELLERLELGQPILPDHKARNMFLGGREERQEPCQAVSKVIDDHRSGTKVE